ncbi:hypothetical protein LUZ60_008208 [Juncus effusus]|nr:hypothetical protein LUZ60_008208 [Juncus effusus]
MPSQPKNAYDIPGLFTFGDSTMDPGNNSILNTETKATFLPYGEDFPTHAPTGRFSNGKLVADYVAMALNLSDTLPAYAGHEVTVNDIGVSFASAGSGLDDLTAQSVKVNTMSDQVQQFAEYIRKLKALKGVRKFAMVGLPPIGCIPLQMTLAALKSGPITVLPKILEPKCVSEQNDDATRYNIKLQQMLQDLQKQFDAIEKSIVFYIDIYNPVFDMATNPTRYGKS